MSHVPEGPGKGREGWVPTPPPTQLAQAGEASPPTGDPNSTLVQDQDSRPYTAQSAPTQPPIGDPGDSTLPARRKPAPFQPSPPPHGKDWPDAASPAYLPAHLKLLQDKFDFLEKLGDGGFGEVWRVHVRNSVLDVERAVKVIKAEAANDHQFIERMVREAQAMARLNHPHAVTVHFASRDPAYIEMDYISGKTLEQVLKEQGPCHRMPLDWTAQFLDQLCSVLQLAHKNQIIHRDLKPSNLMLAGSDGEELNLKVLDFGIAKFLNPAPDAFKTFGGAPLTPMYTSPEQARGETGLDARSDIFAIGLILYQLLTGHHPYWSPGDSIYSAMVDILSEPAPPFRERNPDVCVPESIERLVLRCLEKDPDRRPASAAALAEEFRRLVSLATTLKDPLALQPAQLATPWSQRLRLLAPLLLMFVGIGGAAIGMWVADRMRPVPPVVVTRLPGQWVRSPNSKLIKLGDVYYPKEIERAVGGDKVTALLIERRPAKPGAIQPEPFYIMTDKVWVGLFEVFAREHPDVVKDSAWLQGSDPLLPVRNVTGLQAQAFAEWLGGPDHGALPTPEQWDQAAGRNLVDGPVGPFLGPRDPAGPDQIAVGFDRREPMPVGQATHDVSPYGCRDMSGNGWEWTRPRPGDRPEDDVVLRAQSFKEAKPFVFDDIKDATRAWPFEKPDSQTGFRVVIELDPSG